MPVLTPKDIAEIASEFRSSEQVSWKGLKLEELLKVPYDYIARVRSPTPGCLSRLEALDDSGFYIATEQAGSGRFLKDFEAGGKTKNYFPLLEAVDGEVTLEFGHVALEWAELARLCRKHDYLKAGRLWLEHFTEQKSGRTVVMRGHFYKGKARKPIPLKRLLPFQGREESFVERASIISVTQRYYPYDNPANTGFWSSLRIQQDNSFTFRLQALSTLGLPEEAREFPRSVYAALQQIIGGEKLFLSGVRAIHE